MNKFKALIMAAAALIVVGCTSTYDPKVDFDRNEAIDTSQYKTFAWLKESKIMVMSEDINPVMKLRVDKDIEEAFIAKGYKLVSDPEKADFAISYTVGNRDKIKVDSYPATYHAGFGWGRGYYGGMSMGTETRVRQYTEGRLAIDVYDVKSKQPAWHGFATKRISKDDKENPEGMIELIVTQVVANFN